MSSATSDDVPNELRSTWPQRAWTAILMSLFTTARLVAASGTVATDSLAVALVAFAAYSLADFTTGVYHWFIDNYGDASTAVFGAQIVAFHDHHVHPSTITCLEPCNNLNVVAGAVAVALPVVDAPLLSAGGGSPAAAHAFACTFAACVMLSVQFHAWAHERPSRLPPGVEALQAAGVLVSRSQHAGHHRPPYNSNYCTVSGMWNWALDRYKVFEAVEKVVYLATGVPLRSWGMMKTTERWLR
ncbi:unnamed protein product [Miscanthus lutarioriparius]|uniref:Lipid desaturase domain-containing protein n=1 Tax=Miscanthus lutarioriparius TaxID=422564 RepID=A0A811R797_9POAL|nr:unnamed protein product [Miscanthus lutarioriparius]